MKTLKELYKKLSVHLEGELTPQEHRERRNGIISYLKDNCLCTNKDLADLFGIDHSSISKICKQKNQFYKFLKRN